MFDFESHGILDIASLVIKSIHHYSKKHDIWAIAFQPRDAAEKYIRETLAKGGDFEIGKAGHDIIIVRYSQLKGYPLFCISRELFEQDMQQITAAAPSGKDLACAVERASLEYFAERLSEMQGIRLR